MRQTLEDGRMYWHEYSPQFIKWKEKNAEGKRRSCLIPESLLTLSFIGCSLNYFILNNNVLLGKYVLFYNVTSLERVKKVTHIRMTHNFRCWIQYQSLLKVSFKNDIVGRDIVQITSTSNPHVTQLWGSLKRRVIRGYLYMPTAQSFFKKHNCPNVL